MMLCTNRILLSLSLVTFATLQSIYSKPVDPRCEVNRIPMCQGLYESVSFPNKLNHETQEKAYEEIAKLWPLIHLKCSTQITHFLCRMYAPQCPYIASGHDETHVTYHPEKSRPPCKDSCYQVMRECYHAIVNHEVYWPQELYCENLKNEDCMETAEIMDVKPTDDSMHVHTAPPPTWQWEPETQPPATTPVS